jgi:hypothetical protein
VAENSLDAIVYRHVVYGAGTILTGQTDIRSALIQPEELEAAIVQAMPLLKTRGADQKGGKASKSSQYGLPQATSDLQQILSLYNATVTDGQFIDDLVTDPKAVADRLGLDLSDSAAAAMEQAQSTVVQNFNTFGLPKLVIVAVMIGIALAAETGASELVIDSSGVIKV